MTAIHSHTQALCPVCREKINARLIEREDKIYLQKYCPRHGMSEALVCGDAQWYRHSRAYVKPRQLPLQVSREHYRGCPESCGLCPQHQQHTCLPVIEITGKCDMRCPVCLKDLSTIPHMEPAGFEKVLDTLLGCEGAVPVINLSGGEPLYHPQIEAFLHLAAAKGILQTTVSTNGKGFLRDAALRRAFRETGAIAALQFDGFEPETYRQLRGEDCSGEKQAIIDLLEQECIKYSLVVTVARGINDHEITAITDFFFSRQALSLMFQPAAFTGMAAGFPASEPRLTIPDVVKHIEHSRHVETGDFNPLPCSHFSCFALAYYFIVGDGRFLSLKSFLGKQNYLEVICNRTLPGLDRCGYSVIKERIYDFWSAADSSASDQRILKRIRDVLRDLNQTGFSPRQAFDLGAASMKAVFIHQFMDMHSLDFNRLMKCCNHYAQADGRLKPMCAVNV